MALASGRATGVGVQWSLQVVEEGCEIESDDAGSAKVDDHAMAEWLV